MKKKRLLVESKYSQYLFENGYSIEKQIDYGDGLKHTMYVKDEYRGLGYSKMLNKAILKEAKFFKYNKVYLKSNLINYYEKIGAKFIEKLKNGESLYYIDLN